MINYPSESDTYLAIQEVLIKYFNIADDKYKNLIYVDVGGGEPEFYSNSYYFRNKIDNIIVIEPIKRLCKLFEDRGYPVLNYAAIDSDKGETLFRDYYNTTNGLSFSSVLSNNYGYAFNEYLVPALTLNAILQKHHPEIDKIDILDIDTEGTELLVLNGLDIEKYSPKIIIVENYFNVGNNGYHEYYENIGYEIVAKCAHNAILMNKK